MQLTKYKITAQKCSGYMMVIYADNNFKSVLNEFNPPLTELQLNAILNYIPNNPGTIEAIFAAKYGQKVKVEPVKAIGADITPDDLTDYPVNEKIALWCALYAEYHIDGEGNPIKYKTGAAEAGKMKTLAVTPAELEFILRVYFKATEWFTVPKSISNFVKKYNEIRVLAYAKPVARTFPLPYDEHYFNNLGTNDKRLYWDYLRANGYKFQEANGRGAGKWVKIHTVTQ